MSSNPTRVTINAIGEEGNGKRPHEFHFPIKTQNPVSSSCYARNLVCKAVFTGEHEGCQHEGLKLLEQSHDILTTLIGSFAFLIGYSH